MHHVGRCCLSLCMQWSQELNFPASVLQRCVSAALSAAAAAVAAPHAFVARLLKHMYVVCDLVVGLSCSDFSLSCRGLFLPRVPSVCAAMRPGLRPVHQRLSRHVLQHIVDCFMCYNRLDFHSFFFFFFNL